MLFIVEGPDGSGKSTLVEEFKHAPSTRMLDRACTSEGGPVDNLADWTTDFLNEQQIEMLGEVIRHRYHLSMQVIDRFPLCSEPIYGPVCRGSLAEGFDTGWYHAALLSLLAIRPAIIYCLPPIESVMLNVYDGDAVQMDGVAANIGKIYSLYQTQAHTMAALGIVTLIYDYTIQDRKEFVSDIVREWRRLADGRP